MTTKRAQPNHISLRADKKEFFRLLPIQNFPMGGFGALLLAYTMIIYLSNKIESDLY